MSDLISRSALYMNDLIRRKDVLALFPINDCSDKMVGLYERVLDIPTAYDVDAVVAELEEMIKPKQFYFCKYAKGGCKYIDDDKKDCMECVVEHAIDIVR